MDQRPPDENPSLELLRGTVLRVTFRNPTNGYSVLQIEIEESSDRITCVGVTASAKVGSHVLIKGEYVTHPKFGKQFNMQSLTEAPPASPEGIEKYLSSGLISGIGEKTAKRIVDEFGAEAIEMIKRHPEKVARVPGVGKKKAELLEQAFLAQSEFDETLRFLVEHNISPLMSGRIYERFKEKTLEIIQKDPYILAREIRGIGFPTADQIALNLGIVKDSPLRVRAGLFFALEKAAEDGHCYLSIDSIKDRCTKLLELNAPELIHEELRSLIEQGLLIEHSSRIFSPVLDQAEQVVADFIASRASADSELKIPNSKISSTILEVESEMNLELSPEQKIAVEWAAKHSIVVITGGPGCGKTTIIRAITKMFANCDVNFAMAAPTGRAAQRMSQVCSYPSSTIHRLLKFDPFTNRFVHGIRDPLPFDAVIIDEASMLDISLARDLFSAIPRRCTLILVGDKDQLPSVGPGRVFGDFVSCRALKIIALSRLFRRAEESHINTIAFDINTGQMPNIPSPDGSTKSDAYFVRKEEADEAAKTIESLVADQIPRKFGIPPQDIAVLTPTNRGPIGTIELNKCIQQRLNPDNGEGNVNIGAFELRRGDRVCQRVNNYKLDVMGVYNGDLGTVMNVEPDSGSVSIELWDGRLIEYSRADLSQISLAYAMTVHRSQGMEVPCVVLALHPSHFTLLERQLIYTAVTRAKKLLIIVGSRQALMMATKRATTQKRATMLLERIEKQRDLSRVTYS